MSAQASIEQLQSPIKYSQSRNGTLTIDRADQHCRIGLGLLSVDCRFPAGIGVGSDRDEDLITRTAHFVGNANIWELAYALYNVNNATS